MNKLLPYVDTPARVLSTHVRDRFATDNARANDKPDGWRNVDWPIQHAYEKGRLCSPRGEAGLRWAAIYGYSGVFQIALSRSGRDSTDLDPVSGGGGFPITEAMADAIRQLIAIDSHLSSKDRLIVRKLCEGWSLPGAVRHACGDAFQDTITARVCDALDALIEAIDAAKANGFRYVRMSAMTDA